jgi:serine/threonine-protein kinase
MTHEQGSISVLGQVLGKKYLVRRLLGEGGMGAVYEAEHVLTKRAGALKLLHTSYASVPSVVERFLREASAAGRIGNPHIVETYDAGELASGEPYIFMELLKGSSVRALLQERERIPFAEAREIALQVAEGLGAAHGASIVHRDIKPENLFLCDGERAFVKILDFGISKFAEHHSVARLTEQGSALGTPHYMSPEQVVSKREIDGRVDVYALGVVLYECVTGRVPFDADSLPALSVKIFEGHYRAASTLVPDVPERLDQFFARAMARDPAQRFSSMRELRDALAQLNDPQAQLVAHTLPSVEPTIDSTPSLPAASHSQGQPAPPRSQAAPLPPNGDRYKRRRPVVPLLIALPLAGVSAFLLLRPLEDQPASRDPASPTQPRAASVGHAPTLPASAPLGPSELVPPVPAVASSVGAGETQPPKLPPAAPPSRSARSRAASDGLSERNPFAD